MGSIESPNNWIEKAGGHLKGNSLILPHKFLLIPMTVASEALIKFRAANDLTERIRYGTVVVLMVRIADTAFFNEVAKTINQSQSDSTKKIVICADCIRGQLWPNNLKELRKSANKRVIHKMEDGQLVTNEDLSVVEPYYEEFFKQPLTGPISWERRIGMSLCKVHAPNKKTSRLVELESENLTLKKRIAALESKVKNTDE